MASLLTRVERQTGCRSKRNDSCACARPSPPASKFRGLQRFPRFDRVRRRHTAHPRTMRGARRQLLQGVERWLHSPGVMSKQTPTSYDDIVRRTVPDPDSSQRPSERQEQQAREGFRAMDADETALAARVRAAAEGV